VTVERHAITDRASWLELRERDLTASDLGAWLGVDRFKSRLQLYAEKTMKQPPKPDNAAMQRGRWLEAAVLSAIREKTGWTNVEPCREYLRDPHIRLGATPDAVHFHPQGPPTNIQCKVVSRPVHERDWASGPPLGYMVQTVAEGMLLNAESSYLAALVIDTYTAELFMHPVPRHGGAEARVRALAVEFWSDVAAGKKPPIDFTRDAAVIAAMFPQSVPEPVLDLSADNRIRELLEVRTVLTDEISVAKDALATIDTEIKAKLGLAERAELPGWKLSWKTQERKEYIVPASTHRVLRVTSTEQEEEEAA
jgi:predicted phage-related endonuclease